MAGITTLGGNYVIHLMYRPNGLDEGQPWALACMPHVTNFRTEPHQPNYLRTTDTRGVSCPACKKTTIFEQTKKKERP